MVWIKDNYREAVDQARHENRLVFIDFTGYACANCHWMRANMFSRPEIAAALRNFVLLELYTDGTDAASEANAKMQLARFQTVSQPFYAIQDANERVVATFDGLTKDPAVFLAFLQKGAAPPPAAAEPGTSGSPNGPDLPGATTLEGKPLDPATFAGKVAVVNFWATWCVPCIQEIPGFNRLHKEHAARNVVFLGVSMDEEGAARVEPFLKKHPIDYPVALGGEAISKQYRLDQLPVTVVFDRAGRQVRRFEGFTPEPELNAALREAGFDR
jgi:thiol:disulfide interchange protein